jgi:GNAT superfamily N-acetyltransferase
MNSYTFAVEDAPRDEDVEPLRRGLYDHAGALLESPGFEPLGVFMRDATGAVVGGVWGYVNWKWLFVGLVWLSKDLRGGGYGRQMMEKIEAAALERGCKYSHLDTFSFQARKFYEGLGYEVFATLDDYPEGHQRFFMKKKLA